MKNIAMLIIIFLLGFTFLSGCEQPAADTQAEKKAADSKDAENADADGEETPPPAAYWSPEHTKLRVAVSIPPQKYFIEQIGGDNVEVVSMLEESDDFRTSTPSDDKIAALSQADLFFMIGAPFETKISMPASVVGVDVRKDLKLKPYSAQAEYLNAVKDSHDDPFFWLSPTMVIQSSSAMYLNLRDHSNGDREQIRTNYTHFVRNLNNLEGDIHRILLNSVDSTVYTDYPALGYFGTTFSIKQKVFDSNGGGDINDLARAAIKEDVHTVFFGPFLPQGVQGNLSELIKGTVAPLNPLRADYTSNLLDIAQTIARGSDKAR